MGRVSPNPLVGAVVVRDGTVLGEGWHDEYGGPHAEVNAIAACGDADLHGATLYVSLEPCCHHGHQPPCTEAILEAGLARVVVGGDDPSSKASGRGLGILRDEGVEVDVPGGELATRARLQNQAFRKHARTGRPLVVFKSAMSLDGKVATQGGDSKWISSEGSRTVAHRWRASLDAVAVGIGTALADDPQLTARIDGVHRQPRRVVFDSTARLPLDSKLVSEAPEVPLVVVAPGPRRAARPTRSRPRAPRSSSRPARTSPPACRPRSTSSARSTRRSRASCSRAARTWRARSWTPARSTRCGCSSRRSSSAGGRARPARGRGRRPRRRRAAGAHARRASRSPATCSSPPA